MMIEREEWEPPNRTFDRSAGSHSLAAAGQRDRSADMRGRRVMAPRNQPIGSFESLMEAHSLSLRLTTVTTDIRGMIK